MHQVVLSVVPKVVPPLPKLPTPPIKKPLTPEKLALLDGLVDRYLDISRAQIHTIRDRFEQALTKSYRMPPETRWNLNVGQLNQSGADDMIMTELLVHYITRDTPFPMVVHEGNAGSSIGRGALSGIPFSRIVAEVFRERAIVFVSNPDERVSFTLINKNDLECNVLPPMTVCPALSRCLNTPEIRALRADLVVRKELDARVESKFDVAVFETPVNLLDLQDQAIPTADFFFTRFFPEALGVSQLSHIRRSYARILKRDGAALVQHVALSSEEPPESNIVHTRIWHDSFHQSIRERIYQRIQNCKIVCVDFAGNDPIAWKISRRALHIL